MRYNLAQERILLIEEILDKGIGVTSQLEKALDEGSGIDALIPAFENLEPELKKLEEYYTGKYWKIDRNLDEEGKIPKDLKRGVLSEDGISNLLDKYGELKESLADRKNA